MHTTALISMNKMFISRGKMSGFILGLRRFSSCDDKSALSDISVIDLTRIVAGPYCTMLLGDLGANVIKVEHPKGGDEARKWGPPFLNSSTDSCYFASLNRNKKSVCIDIKNPLGASIIYDLAKKCDVLVENYVPGKLDSFGLGYDQLKEVAPHLIYCSITGFGPDGPYALRPGYDVIAAGFGGLLGITGEEEGGPVKVGVAVTDMATGLYAYGSIMAALLARNKIGKGQKIDCNLLSTQIASLINLGSNYLNCGKVATRRGTAHESIVPYQAFSTSDGYLIIGTGSDNQFCALCKILNIENIAVDDKFSTNVMRVKNREELIDTLQRIFSSKTTEDWMTLLEGAPFPYGPVNTIDRVFQDPHVKHLNLVKELDHPVSGKLKVVGPPVKFSEGGNFIRSQPPLLGEHTEDILRNVLEYNEDKIKLLQSKSVIP